MTQGHPFDRMVLASCSEDPKNNPPPSTTGQRAAANYSQRRGIIFHFFQKVLQHIL